MNVFDFIKELKLPADEFVVEGSGVLDALGIRQARDLDIVVGASTFEKLQKQGYVRKVLHGTIPYVEKGNIEAWLDFDGKNFDELQAEAIKIRGYSFASLEQMKKWKQQRALEKDKKDLKLIEKFIQENTGH